MHTNQNSIGQITDKRVRPKLAVIGTGAAGLGVLVALLAKRSDAEVVVYDVGKRVAEAPSPDNPSEEWVDSFYDKIYKEIRSLYPFKFPPPKTHLAKQISKQPVGERLEIFKSESFGGLTNYWGATMLPFTAREMTKWPISKEELEPYYQRIAEIVGLAARPDALNEYFVRDFATRPPIRPFPALSSLNEIINARENKSEEFKIISGLNRCAIETRENKLNHCLYCGECLTGCFRDTVYSSRLTINQYLKNPRVRYIKAKVTLIKKGTSLEIQTDKGYREGGFSKVFLGAGCPASTEIIMRSLGLKNKLVMNDNATYVFPIFYLGKKSAQARHQSYLALCNLIFGCVPKATTDHFAQVSIYPNFDYLWRYNIPPKLWPIIRPLILFSRSRIFWARLFIHSDYSQAYSLELDNERLIFNQIKKAEPDPIKKLMPIIRRAVNHGGFYVPSIPPICQKVNSHYAGTLAFGNKAVEVSAEGEIMSNVYLCDSSCFPDSPAVSPTFTIMANACRIADKVVF